MGNELSLIQSHNWVTFLLARLYLRKDDQYYSYLLYSYLRSADDFVDEKDASESEKKQFVHRQQKIIKSLYENCNIDANPLISRIVKYDLKNGCKLKPCIFRMLKIFEFDANRKNKLVSSEELKNYSVNLATAYTQLLLYFTEPRYEYQREDALLAHACHLAHMLRDFKEDQRLGYINISKEEIAQYNIQLNKIPDEGFQEWLRDRIKIIQSHFKKGKAELDKNPILRTKIMGYLYCFRYEAIIRQIKEAEYQLKNKYPMRLQDIIRLISIFISVLLNHLWQKIKL